MTWFAKNPGYNFKDLGELFTKTNSDVYDGITSLGLEVDPTDKDQQKIYYHHLLVNLCEMIKHSIGNGKVVFYCNEWDCTPLQKKMIKNIRRLFGFKIWIYPLTFHEFTEKLRVYDLPIMDKLEVYIFSDKKPKSMKVIKKNLEKDGFKSLVNDYFECIGNKMAVLY